MNHNKQRFLSDQLKRIPPPTMQASWSFRTERYTLYAHSVGREYSRVDVLAEGCRLLAQTSRLSITISYMELITLHLNMKKLWIKSSQKDLSKYYLMILHQMLTRSLEELTMIKTIIFSNKQKQRYVVPFKIINIFSRPYSHPKLNTANPIMYFKLGEILPFCIQFIFQFCMMYLS